MAQLLLVVEDLLLLIESCLMDFFLSCNLLIFSSSSSMFCVLLCPTLWKLSRNLVNSSCCLSPWVSLWTSVLWMEKLVWLLLLDSIIL